ncbi:monosaccharide ABC transporter substrate-binding protein (CUT2 family) [Haloactinopolyspora alba]|uniref:Monosaccharide ABC transporter substrate-binding protein (CUT2 family) n=1 Tax=Haloactinopolyspora alba TaxID=648780 RepID=A0A2P8E5G2_9ACTN|nr:ABC transporter substrate-binding protein [Haloactinopolyspora alba]PSL04692.1 monosaccharide ABC transporter substrate-binding protein (CUT2 family) [Haloactinopolyspora alba]
MSGNTRSRRTVRLLSLTAAGALAFAACTNTGGEDGSGSDTTAAAGEGDAQVVREPTEEPTGTGCTIDSYGNGNVEGVPLAEATVGFSQSEPDTAAFRAAETKSIKDEAKNIGVAELIVTNANGELPKQISDIQDMLNQGVDYLVVAPVNSDGLDPALDAAREKGVPVLTIDRKVTNEHCTDYISFLGSDFYQQGTRAADAMNEVTGGEANVAILRGSSGNNVTEERNAGFVEHAEAEYPGLKIVAEQTANFARDEGQAVTEQLLQSNPEIDAIYAHNDEMGLGAMTAISAAGRAPGQDVKIVSIDGTRNAVQAIVDGRYNVVIESNPRFGPLAFQTLQRFIDGESIREDIVIEDGMYDSSNAEADLSKAF